MIYICKQVEDITDILKELKHEKALDYDKEFRGAVFKAMPRFYQDGWTRFTPPPSSTEWSGFEVYLESAYSMALRARLEVASVIADPSTHSRESPCFNFQNKISASAAGQTETSTATSTASNED